MAAAAQSLGQRRCNIFKQNDNRVSSYIFCVCVGHTFLSQQQQAPRSLMQQEAVQGGGTEIPSPASSLPGLGEVSNLERYPVNNRFSSRQFHRHRFLNSQKWILNNLIRNNKHQLNRGQNNKVRVSKIRTAGYTEIVLLVAEKQSDKVTE